jgi:hypothetical protein
MVTYLNFGYQISPEKRKLMFNYDRSSCFMHSLLVALFFPSRMCLFDQFFLEMKSILGDEDDEIKTKVYHLSKCLSFIASIVRGNVVSDPNIRYARSTIGRLVTEIRLLKEKNMSFPQTTTTVDFAFSQQDPADLLENFLSIFKIKGVFQTLEYIQRVYTNGKVTNDLFVHKMYRQSVVALVASNQLDDLEKLFPYTDKLVVDGAFTSSEVSDLEEEDVLLSKTTTVHYAGGPALFITREIVETEKNPIKYGTYNKSNNSYTLKFFNVLKNECVTFQLQSIICYYGCITKQKTMGHYVCYVYEEEDQKWWFYNDLDKNKENIVCLKSLPDGNTVETFPLIKTHNDRMVNPFMPSTNGTLFIYAQL